LQVRRNSGKWLLRIEDIDPPREPPGAASVILHALEAYGFQWDGPVFYQSQSTPRHENLIATLLAGNHAYRCSCSRRDLASASRGPLGIIYPGTCRRGTDAGDFAIRLKTHDEPVTFSDLLQGAVCQRLESESGDFVIKRRDGPIAYHLAVVADDYDQGITEIVRGIDLLDSTPRQIHLQQCLGFSSPAYLHIPVVNNPDGTKLSKLTGARAIDTRTVRPTLLMALRALGQRPPQDLANAAVPDIWDWAIRNWDPAVLAGRKSIPIDQFTLAERQNGLS
jgi:glutamyl-Q tRNA(Asp) synthetase